MTPLALNGIKIIDIGYYLPAAYCTQMLGDMGADVIKIEEPITARHRRGGAGVSAAPGEGAEKKSAYDFFNRNKKSVILDMKSKEALDIFHHLAGQADVMIENMRPGVVKRLGIDYDALKVIHPRLIYCSISGFGQDSPYKNLAGHDPNYCSIAGAQMLNLDRDKKPIRFGVPLGDIGTALHAAIGILLAVIARGHTGRGQYIDTSMTDSVFSFVSRSLRGWINPDLWPGTEYEEVVLGPLEVKNGQFITVGNIEPYFWERFCKAVGREDFIPFKNAKGEKGEVMTSEIKRILLTKTRDEWVDILTRADTAIAPVLEAGEVLNDPHIQARQLVLDLDHPTQGKVKHIGFPIKLSDTPGQVRSFAPFAGQHTEEVLRSLGYSEDEIKMLKEKGIIQ
ncbi:MAG: CoA transferase [Deltaproteobacteria bacterium]|nr:CoA transferase [Deltaproteobacteria bacterium]